MDTKINRKEFIRVPDKNYSILRVYMKAEHIFIKVQETRKVQDSKQYRAKAAGAQLSFMDDSMPMESLARCRRHSMNGRGAHHFKMFLLTLLLPLR